MEKKPFKNFITALSPSASVPTRRVLLEFMRAEKEALSHDVGNAFVGEHECFITDGWTSCANDTYLSLTVAYINTDWKLITLVLNCEKMEGSTTGDDLAKFVETKVEGHGLRGHVVACTTDCESSMVRAGRILGYTNHGLELVSSIGFDGPGVKKTTIPSRARWMTASRSCLSRQTCHRPS